MSENDSIRVRLTTDDAEEAFAELRDLRARGEVEWDMAEVRWMPNPPRTTNRYVVFRRDASVLRANESPH